MKLMLTIVELTLILTYPMVVYVGLQRWPPHELSLALLGLLGALIGTRRLLAHRSAIVTTDHGPSVLPWLAAALLTVGALLQQDVFAMGVPVLVSGSLLSAFVQSLYSPQSLVERIARRQEPDLSPAKVRHCRQVTVVWCWFFALNIVVTLGLIVAAPLSWWTLYTGLVSYVLIGALFAGEYVVRKARFRSHGVVWRDRTMTVMLPPQDTNA